MKIFLTLLILPFFICIHDINLSCYLKLNQQALIEITERNFDDELSGGTNYPIAFRFIDEDKSETPDILEYAILLNEPYILKNDWPKLHLSYSRIESAKGIYY